MLTGPHFGQVRRSMSIRRMWIWVLNYRRAVDKVFRDTILSHVSEDRRWRQLVGHVAGAHAQMLYGDVDHPLQCDIHEYTTSAAPRSRAERVNWNWNWNDADCWCRYYYENEDKLQRDGDTEWSGQSVLYRDPKEMKTAGDDSMPSGRGLGPWIDDRERCWRSWGGLKLLRRNSDQFISEKRRTSTRICIL